jgi:hypothetical protein
VPIRLRALRSLCFNDVQKFSLANIDDETVLNAVKLSVETNLVENAKSFPGANSDDGPNSVVIAVILVAGCSGRPDQREAQAPTESEARRRQSSVRGRRHDAAANKQVPPRYD